MGGPVVATKLFRDITYTDRAKLIADNPVAAARFFQMLLRGIFRDLFGIDLIVEIRIDSHYCSRKCGLFGEARAYFVVL